MARIRSPLLLGLSAAAWTALAAPPALAQRADDNVIADAEDAFGSNDGGEDLGLYTPFSVRGFSPIDAGNVRLEGLYIDRQGDLGPRLAEGSRIRVGPSATSYAFPAPSGVVDYRLRTPGREAALSLVTQANSFGGYLAELDGALPIGDDLSVGGGVSRSLNEYASGNNAEVTHLAAVAHWRPAAGAEAKLFWGRSRIADEDIYPIVLGDGTDTPPELKRRRFLGQPWADVETERFTYGGIGQAALGDFGVRLGVFRSVNEVTEGHSVFLQAAAPGQPAARQISAYPGRYGASTSGELRIARTFNAGDLGHRVLFVARGRAQERRYGGGQRIAIAPAPFGEVLQVARPEFRFSPQSADGVRQWSVGLDYQLRVAGLGQASVGVQKVDYRKRVTTPAGVAPASRDAPWLFNAALAVDVAEGLSLYGSHTRGLEESDVAPETAANRDEAPPAIRTRQTDGGATLRVRGMTLVAGVFDIRRPYYGVDREAVFRSLGAVRHRGVEASLIGSPAPGLTLVAGGAWMEARLTGREVADGLVGRRPVDVPARKLIASVEWRPPGSASSFDLTAEHIGANTGDTLNRVRVAPYTVVNVGLRHRFRAGDAAAVLRLQATNLFDSYGWEVAGSNAFVYAQSRQILARLTVDF